MRRKNIFKIVNINISLILLQFLMIAASGSYGAILIDFSETVKYIYLFTFSLILTTVINKYNFNLIQEENSEKIGNLMMYIQYTFSFLVVIVYSKYIEQIIFL